MNYSHSRRIASITCFTSWPLGGACIRGAQVGWSAGLYSVADIDRQMARAVELLAPPLGF